MENGLDNDSFTIMITWVSPHIDQEKITPSVLEYCHLFQSNRKEKIAIKDDMRIGMDLIKLEFNKINASLVEIKEYQEKYKLDQNQIQEISSTHPLTIASNYYTAQLQNDA